MPLPEPPAKPSTRTTITWIVIGLLLILVAAWTVWAGHQPHVASEWAPE
jgi:hypothetical protein